MMFISAESIKISWRMRRSLKLQTWGMTVTRRKRNLLPKSHDKKAVPWLSLASLEKTPTPWILLGEYMKRRGKNRCIFSENTSWDHTVYLDSFQSTFHVNPSPISSNYSLLGIPSQCTNHLSFAHTNHLAMLPKWATLLHPQLHLRRETLNHKNVASVRFLFSWFSGSKFRKKLRLMVFFGRMNFRRSHLRPAEISGCSQQTPVE